MATKRTTKKLVAPPSESSTESELIAHEILKDYRDLAPSVNKIMNAELSEPGKMQAITAFRASLGVIGDPMRDPQNAIAAARSLAG